MKHARRRLTYANVMSSLAVFLVLAGGTAFAALAKNSVGPKQLKANAVTTAKIKNGAVAAGKIQAGAIDTSKLAPNAVTGANINVGTLPPVPNATSAQNLAGLFFAVVKANGTLVRGTPGVTSVASSGGYLVSLPGVASAKDCFFVGSLGGGGGGPELGEISLNPSVSAASANAIFVVAAKSNGEPTSKEFTLMARC